MDSSSACQRDDDDQPTARRRMFIAALLWVALLPACNASSGGSNTATEGTLSGFAFSVVAGTLYQDAGDGPVYADSAGGTLEFSDDPGSMGMTDPDQLQFRVRVELESGGSVGIVAYADAAVQPASGLSIVVDRSGASVGYAVRLGGTQFTAANFAPAPSDPGAGHWVVSEFYAQNVPRYGTGSGVSLWNLDDVNPMFNSDIIGCPAARQVATLNGDRVGLEIRSARVAAVQVVDTIHGPCE